MGLSSAKQTSAWEEFAYSRGGSFSFISSMYSSTNIAEKTRIVVAYSHLDSDLCDIILFLERKEDGKRPRKPSILPPLRGSLCSGPYSLDYCVISWNFWVEWRFLTVPNVEYRVEPGEVLVNVFVLDLCFPPKDS
jgi:hypothetical protein